MVQSIRIAPTNSLIFVSDSDGGVGPDFVRGLSILSTSSCISVACLMWQDGETELTLGPANRVDPGGIPAFDGSLETPNRAVIVSTVERRTVLSANVPDRRTRVRIWTNRVQEPDVVIVGLG